MNSPTAHPLLEVRDATVWYPIRRGIISRTVGHVRAVDGVSFKVQPGETVGLVGESGCGKSTLARAIMHLEKTRSGSVFFDGRDITASADAETRLRRRELQMIFQDPYSSLNPRMSVLDIVTEGMLQHGIITSGERESAATELLDDVGLGADALYRYPHEFSGGQRQRVSVARAISMKPKLIVCDEPVSALDVSVQAQVINLLMDLRDTYKLSYLFISHDLSVVKHVADRLLVMYLGRIVEDGPTREVINNPIHPYTRALISAIPKIGSDDAERIVLSGDVPSPSSPPSGCHFHTRCPFANDRCKDVAPELETVSEERRVACLRKDETLRIN
ncbi:MAG: oligopeptide/dipeptide ABC transporter ATP-binding protein [Kiritimatiellia bacterium]|jgi:oligopeptide/dipeptide ABC transporter ATP-binding protein